MGAGARVLAPPKSRVAGSAVPVPHYPVTLANARIQIMSPIGPVSAGISHLLGVALYAPARCLPIPHGRLASRVWCQNGKSRVCATGRLPPDLNLSRENTRYPRTAVMLSSDLLGDLEESSRALAALNVEIHSQSCWAKSAVSWYKWQPDRKFYSKSRSASARTTCRTC